MKKQTIICDNCSKEIETDFSLPGIEINDRTFIPQLLSLDYGGKTEEAHLCPICVKKYKDNIIQAFERYIDRYFLREVQAREEKLMYEIKEHKGSKIIFPSQNKTQDQNEKKL